jgi:hypothetical protein
MATRRRRPGHAGGEVVGERLGERHRSGATQIGGVGEVGGSPKWSSTAVHLGGGETAVRRSDMRSAAAFEWSKRFMTMVGTS